MTTLRVILLGLVLMLLAIPAYAAEATLSTQHMMILGLALAGATPAIVAWMKAKVINHPGLSAVMPFAITVVVWLGDALMSGVSPFGDAGLAMLITALTGSLAGAKGRDVYKHTMNGG